MSVDAGHLLLAAGPIVVVLAFLLRRVPALVAGFVGALAAMVVAVIWFPATGEATQAAVETMAPTAVEVALILLGGVGLAEAMTRTGVLDHIAGWLAEMERSPDRTVTLLLLVYGMTPFMESVTGFGLGVLITAPLLVRLGLTPVKAVIAGLLGLVLIPWGSLGPGTLVAAQLGGEPFQAVGVWSALLTLPVQIVSMTALFILVIGRPRARQLVLAAGVVLLEWVTVVAVNLTLGPPLAGVLASAAVIAGLLLVVRRAGALPRPGRGLLVALIPYVVLVGGILVTTAVLTLAGSAASAAWATSPGLWLIVAAIVALLPIARPSAPLGGAARTIVVRWLPIACNALVFMAFGVVMSTAGMAEYLALAATRLGDGFLFTVPALGALGGYLTGSNTGAAAMFSAATTSSAASLSADPLIALAGQNAAGALAIIASPPRIALACSGVLPAGQRFPAAATRHLATVVAVAAVLLGASVFVLA